MVPIGVHAPVILHAAVPTLVAHPPAAIAVHAAVHAAPVHVVSAPVVVPHVVAVAPVEGTYIAKTLGAVHIAPLPGHANSAASVNLEPAPGTV